MRRTLIFLVLLFVLRCKVRFTQQIFLLEKSVVYVQPKSRQYPYISAVVFHFVVADFSSVLECRLASSIRVLSIWWNLCSNHVTYHLFFTTPWIYILDTYNWTQIPGWIYSDSELISVWNPAMWTGPNNWFKKIIDKVCFESKSLNIYSSAVVIYSWTFWTAIFTIFLVCQKNKTYFIDN